MAEIASKWERKAKGFLYMGKVETEHYTYFAFKEAYGPLFKIMRKNVSNPAEWLYYLGSTGAAGFAADWADPTILEYIIPPDER